MLGCLCNKGLLSLRGQKLLLSHFTSIVCVFDCPVDENTSRYNDRLIIHFVMKFFPSEIKVGDLPFLD